MTCKICFLKQNNDWGRILKYGKFAWNILKASGRVVAKDLKNPNFVLNKLPTWVSADDFYKLRHFG